jgi:hypothetical protein
MPTFQNSPKAKIHNLMICSITLSAIIVYIENTISAAYNVNYSDLENLLCHSINWICRKDSSRFIQVAQDSTYNKLPNHTS